MKYDTFININFKNGDFFNASQLLIIGKQYYCKISERNIIITLIIYKKLKQDEIFLKYVA